MGDRDVRRETPNRTRHGATREGKPPRGRQCEPPGGDDSSCRRTTVHAEKRQFMPEGDISYEKAARSSIRPKAPNDPSSPARALSRL